MNIAYDSCTSLFIVDAKRGMEHGMKPAKSQSLVNHESVTSDCSGCNCRIPVGDEGVIF